jgi:Rieske Fe-S protein
VRDVPLWRDEFSVHAAEERYVARRQFGKFLVLTSLGMFVGQLWILLKTWWRGPTAALPEVVVGRLGEIPVGGVRLFRYPEPTDPCLLVRTGEDSYVAYSQKCTHLSCAVYYDAPRTRLYCPCHDGAFSVEDGRVLQGPPPRPLPRLRLERRGDELVVTGFMSAEG